VVEAFKLVRARAPHLEVDGELQADAALVEAVGRAKSPDSRVPGHANTLIFPNLVSGNIGYKLTEWMAAAWPSARCCKASPSRPTISPAPAHPTKSTASL